MRMFPSSIPTSRADLIMSREESQSFWAMRPSAVDSSGPSSRPITRVSQSTQSGSFVQAADTNRSTDIIHLDTTHLGDAPQFPDATQLPESIQDDSPDARNDRKVRTCVHWTNGSRIKTDKECEYAHHLFPTIVYRAVDKGYKAVPCKYSDNCWWPRDICGWSHGDDEAAAALFNKLDQEKGWSAVMSYVCKKCTTSFDELEQVVEHCRTSHQPPQPLRPGAPATSTGDSTHAQQGILSARHPQGLSRLNWDELAKRRREAGR